MFQKPHIFILTLCLPDEFLDTRIVLVDEQFAAVEADAAQHFEDLGEECDVEDRLGQLHVGEVAGALGQCSCTGLAAGRASHCLNLIVCFYHSYCPVLSTTPCLGSMSPPILGFPFS